MLSSGGCADCGRGKPCSSPIKKYMHRFTFRREVMCPIYEAGMLRYQLGRGAEISAERVGTVTRHGVFMAHFCLFGKTAAGGRIVFLPIYLNSANTVPPDSFCTIRRGLAEFCCAAGAPHVSNRIPPSGNSNPIPQKAAEELNPFGTDGKKDTRPFLWLFMCLSCLCESDTFSMSRYLWSISLQ